MKRLVELNERHKAACRLRVEGHDNAYIARQLEVTKATLVKWFSDDLIKEYIRELSENVEANFAEKLATAGLTALAELQRLLGMPDADASLSANQKREIANDLMDRLPATSRVRERGVPADAGGNAAPVVNLIQQFGEMPNGELANFLNGGWRQMMESGGDGDGSQALPAGN